MRSFLIGFTVLVALTVFEVAAQTKKVTIESLGGTLQVFKIKTDSEAQVFVDGLLYGRSDQKGLLTVRTPKALKHEVRVRKSGFAEGVASFTAKQTEVLVPLTRSANVSEQRFIEAAFAADKEKSQELLEKAVAANSKNVLALLGLGRAYAEAGDSDSAFATLKKARAVKPILPEATAIEARIYRDIGDEAKAIASFKKAIKEGKGINPEAFTGLGLLYKEKADGYGGSGDYENEAKYYQEAANALTSAAVQLGGSPDGTVILENLGMVYEKMSRTDDAVVVYSRFLDIFPNHTNASAIRSFIVQLHKPNK